MPRARPTPNQPGAPTARYPQRTDLAAQSAAAPKPPPTQPVRTPTGQGYGEAGALAASQQQFPLPQPPDTPQMMPGTTTPMAAQAYTPPNMALSSTPSGLANEPVTAGLPVGPGARPSMAQSPFNGAALLGALAAATGDERMAELADIADAQGF